MSDLTSEQLDMMYQPGDDWNYDVEAEPARDTDQANRHMQRVRSLRLRADEVAEMYSKEIERLRYEMESQCDTLAKAWDWHERSVAEWHRRELAAGRVGKTVKLPAGQSSLRHRKPALEIEDEAELLAWIEGEGLESLLNAAARRTPSKSALKDLFGDVEGEPGELVPLLENKSGKAMPGGVAMRVQEDSHSVKVEK